MFHPKLGSPEGAEVTYEQVEGVLVAIALGDRRGSSLSSSHSFPPSNPSLFTLLLLFLTL